MITAYHAKYFAHALLRSSTEDGVEKISRSLFDAAVDSLRKRLEQETEHDTLFMIRWRVI